MLVPNGNLAVSGGVFFFSETACPIVNFVKICVNRGQVVLIWLQVCHSCENHKSAEKPVISRLNSDKELIYLSTVS